MGSPVSSITSCVSANEVIVGTNGNTGRIYGSIGDNVTIGATGTTSANKGLATAKVTSAGSTVTLVDGLQHGTNVGASTLRLKSNYVGMGWDFDNYWKIQETECYPYKASQCAPPKITSQLISGATSVSGQSIDGGTVVLITGNNSYSGAVASNQWTINIPSGLQSGAIVKACATKSGLMQSYFTTGTVGFAGSGTEDDPYLIYTASDLANINSYSYYKIMNDIDVSGWITANSPTTGWIPVGMNSGVSMKQLDGNGKTISGFWTNSTTNYYGLISTTNDAIIKDLTINLSKNSKVGANSAVLVGKSNNSTFTNIIINGNLGGGTCLGSITGLGTGNTFENCKVTSNVTSSGVAAGGICGNSTSSSYNNCRVTGQIKGTNYTGGIAGGEAGSNTFTLCFVEGTITGSNYTGGIAPYCTKSVTKCKSNSTITGSSYVGGLIGKNNATVSECFSDGSVKATATSDCYAGGLFGTNNGNVTNCYSNSTVTSGEYAAGIAGINYGSIDKCYASGNITAVKWGAGITGYNDGNGATVTNCFATNNKIQVSEAGGIGMRMIGGFRNGASEPNNTNYALNSMVVSVNNVTKIIYDDPLEGISVTQAQLYAQSTYVNNGWNFTDIWGIDEGNGYPFLLALAEPEFTPGDVNSDGTINVYDYVSTASYILEKDPQPFVFAAADLDENLSITVSDLVGVAYLALTYEGAPMLALAIGTHEAASLAMDATISSTASGQYEVSINLSNNIALTAMQMDINLPEGMTLVDASLSDRASASHQVDFNMLASGDYRVLAASSTIKSFKNNDGTVLTLTLAGTPSGDGRLSNIVLASPDAESYTVDDITLNFNTTGVFDIYSDARIYREGGNIVIMAPCDSQAQIVMPNGMYKTVKVAAGRNVYQAPSTGIIIVKMGDVVKKMRF
ncbi:MAG: dockerin type I repeat-containing protein [Bacteroidales bacterium]|nr:dockerin type I repeat-containing protein [Bacteroidales bacterium]